MKNFAMTGVGGFVAPRHLKAIHDTGHRLVAAVDPHDAVGMLDRYCVRRPVLHGDRAVRSPPREASPRTRGRARGLSQYLLAKLPARRAYPSGAAGRRRCDLREAAGDQSLESRCAAGNRSGDQTPRPHRPAVAMPSGSRCAQGEARCRAGRAQTRGDADLHHRARPLVRRVVEGPRRAIGRRRDEHRDSFLRPADLAVRSRSAMRGEPAPARTARPAISSWSAPRCGGSCPRTHSTCRPRRWRRAERPFAPYKSMARTSSSAKVLSTCTPVYERMLAGQGLGIDDARPSIELAHQIRHALVTTSPTSPHPILLHVLS